MGIFDPWAGFGVTFRTIFRKTFTQATRNRARRRSPLPGSTAGTS